LNYPLKNLMLALSVAIGIPMVALAGNPLDPGYDHGSKHTSNEGYPHADPHGHPQPSSTSHSNAVGGNSSATGGSATGGAGGNSSSTSAGGAGGNSAATADNANNASLSTSVTSNYEAKRIPVSSAYAPALTSGIDTCLGSASGGLQTAPIGFSFGKTTIDENCVMLKQARMLHEMGMRVAAWQRMCQVKETRKALLDSGEYDCKSTAAELAQAEESQRRAKLATEQREKDQAEATARYWREQKENEALIERGRRAKIEEEILKNHTKKQTEFGTPTFTEPQQCKPEKKSKNSKKSRGKWSTMPPCK
jgi:hypothetical protein